MTYELLIVEDNQGIIDALTGEFQQAFGNEMNVESCSFRHALSRVRSMRPDILVLDRFEGDLVDAARPIYDYIWQTHFCPIIIYSAFEAAGSGYEKTHPFYDYQQKNQRNSLARVVSRAKGFLDQAAGLRALRDEIDDRIASSLKSVSPLVWREPATLDQRRDLLRRVTRRRLAASLDSPSSSGDTVTPLEQFIYPPLEPNLLTGDILRRRTAKPGDGANAFRVILTPSCDLQTGSRRHPVSKVLLARCIAVNDPEVLRLCGLQECNAAKLPKALGGKLKSDDRESICVLPALSDEWPVMVVDFKRLELISRTKISLAKSHRERTTSLYRVASSDSPFRERLAWRYVETGGRPGLPDFDRDTFERDIVRTATSLSGE